MKHFAMTFHFEDRFGESGGFEEMCHIVQEAVASFARNPTKKDAKDHIKEDLWKTMDACQTVTSSVLRHIARRSMSVDEAYREQLDEKIDQLLARKTIGLEDA